MPGSEKETTRDTYWRSAWSAAASSSLRVGEQLVRGSGAGTALALELLDVTLTTEQKGLLFPLVRPVF